MSGDREVDLVRVGALLIDNASTQLQFVFLLCECWNITSPSGGAGLTAERLSWAEAIDLAVVTLPSSWQLRRGVVGRKTLTGHSRLASTTVRTLCCPNLMAF